MIKNNLSRILGEKRMKMTELCLLTGLSKSTVFRIYHDQISNISIETIDKLCNALECNTQELFEHIPE